MSLSPQFLDELRARTLLSGVISPSVKLLRAGREWKACCPFHQEKTPSFTINDDKGFYHCFGCGAHGDAIRFLTEARGLPFIEAVKELAGKAGMDVPAADPRAQEKAERATGLTDVMAAAQRWFAETLASKEGEQARAYLKARNVNPALAARFGLGLAPNARNRLKAALNSFGEQSLIDTGMLIKPEDRDESYDRFRGRLMIPIRDPRGRVIAFGGRILGDGEPKYLNSPETVLFDKGRTLYNIDRAAPASRTAKRLIVVEGYMDVIALDRAGISEVVAPNGTAVTEAQLERMWRLDPAPILCFDGDSAGQKAAIRAATRALPFLGPERTLGFVSLPQGQDPDDLSHSGGRAALDALFAEPQPLVEHLWQHERDAAPLSTPEARAGLKQRLIDHARTIGDRSLASLYRDEWLARFEALVRPERKQRGAARSFEKRGKFDPRTRRFIPPEGPTGPEMRAIGTGGIDGSMANALLTGFALFPQALGQLLEDFLKLKIADKAANKAREELLELVLSEPQLDRDTLATILGFSTAPKLGARRGSLDFTFTRPDADPGAAARDLASTLQALAASAEIEDALGEATRALANGEDEAFAEQQRLHRARDEIKERLALLAGNE